jgi:hypothetical protein
MRLESVEASVPAGFEMEMLRIRVGYRRNSKKIQSRLDLLRLRYTHLVSFLGSQCEWGMCALR